MHPQELLQRCADLGFALAGVCEAAPSDHGGHVLRWIAEGRHGEMRYLATRVEMRLDPRVLVPGARSILLVADRYADGRSDRLGRPLFGRIARYARGRDYHRTMRRRLTLLRDECRARWPDERFRACVDTAPLLEREHAARAGLGRIGKHTLLIAPGLGSWLLLGAIVSTMIFELTPAVPTGDPCGTCTRCIDACPTACITPWSVDASACLSYLTLEHRGEIDPRFHAAMGDWLVGCDVCQEVCPHCQPTRRSRRAGIHPDYQASQDGIEVLKILDWTEADRAQVAEGTALERVSLPMLKRNAAIVAANTCPSQCRGEVIERLRRLAAAEEEPEMVRRTAERCAGRLAEEV